MNDEWNPKGTAHRGRYPEGETNPAGWDKLRAQVERLDDTELELLGLRRTEAAQCDDAGWPEECPDVASMARLLLKLVGQQAPSAAPRPPARWVRVIREMGDEGPTFARLEREEPGRVLVTFADGASAWRKAWTEVAP